MADLAWVTNGVTLIAPTTIVLCLATGTTSHHQGDLVSQELFDRFKKCAVDVLSVDASKITPEASFGDDLDADSLDLVELVMALEEEFGIEVPESDLEGVDTVGKAFALVTSKVK
jgi:acyl carrier protein